MLSFYWFPFFLINVFFIYFDEKRIFFFNIWMAFSSKVSRQCYRIWMHRESIIMLACLHTLITFNSGYTYIYTLRYLFYLFFCTQMQCTHSFNFLKKFSILNVIFFSYYFFQDRKKKKQTNKRLSFEFVFFFSWKGFLRIFSLLLSVLFVCFFRFIDKFIKKMLFIIG